MAVLNNYPEVEPVAVETGPEVVSFPTHFADLSHKSLQDIEGKGFEPLELTVPDADEFEQPAPQMGDVDLRLEGVPRDWEGRLFKLEPSSNRVKVVGIDTTCRRIGRTRSGFLCALRGTVAWRDDYAYRYQRYGPLLFHMNGRNSGLLGNRQTDSALLMGVEALFEREIQSQVCHHFKDSIILLDGCLATHGSDPAEKAGRLEAALSVARRNGNSVLAFSKHTRICVGERDASTLLDNWPHHCILYVGDLASEQFKTLKLLGHTFIAKLSPTGYSFRMDIDKELGLLTAVATVQKLMGSEVIVQGYPEVLRLAHIFSIFTAMEVLGIQRFLATHYGLRIERPRHTRRLLFGPFGKWDGA